jgi:6-phosphogluconolactonase
VKQMVIHTEKDLLTAGHRAARTVAAIARDAIASRGRFTVALAGGSSPTPVHDALALARAEPDLALDWARTHALFGDERAVPPDHPDSNYGRARQSLLDRVPIPAEHIHPMRAWEPDLDEAARAYERTLESVCEPDGALDLLVLGVGQDAHVLSLFPGCHAIRDDGGHTVLPLRDPPMNPAISRLTLTPTALRRARAVLLLVFGANKRSAWEALRDEAGDEGTHPVRLLRTLTCPVTVVGDRDALGPR